MIPRTKLSCKGSQMPCNLVNFISVNRESQVGGDGSRGRTQEQERKE